MVKGVIFDLDGTLLDTMSEWRNIGEAYLRSKGISVEENISEVLEPMSLEESSKYFIEKYKFDLSIKEVINEITSLIYDKYKYHFKLKPYAIDYIESLSKNNIKMCIATATNHDSAVAALKRLGIEGYFEFVLTCDEVGCSKSYASIYLECARRLNINIEDIIVYEDSLKCIETAKKAGFKVVGVHDESSKGTKDDIKKVCDKYILGFEELL